MKSRALCGLRRIKAEDGAVTVDWVVLTALLVPLGILVGNAIWGETEGVATKVGNYMGTVSVATGTN